jgi:hypothetical protein
MSVYLCDMCDNYVDADYLGCNESPISMYGCVCDDCFNNLDPDHVSVKPRNLRDYVGADKLYAQWSRGE